MKWSTKTSLSEVSVKCYDQIVSAHWIIACIHIKNVGHEHVGQRCIRLIGNVLRPALDTLINSGGACGIVCFQMRRSVDITAK